MNVNPGELNKKITIKKFDSLTGESTVVRECWAKVSNTSGKEIIVNDLGIESLTTRFLVRYTKVEIDDSMEIYFKGKIYSIKYVNDYNYSNEYVEILAEFKEWNREI